MQIIKSDRIYRQDGLFDGFMMIEDGRIIGFEKHSTAKVISDYTGKIILPGMVNTHLHGTYGYEFTGEYSIDNHKTVRGFVEGCAANGDTAVFPTISDPFMYREIVEEIESKDVSGARIMGIHSEGPFSARGGENGAPVQAVEVNITRAEKIVTEARGHLKLMALAPELPGIEEVVKLLRMNVIKIAMAHTTCTEQQADHFISEFNIDIATHIGDCMRGIHHRDAGTLGVCLLRDDMMAELIGDLYHLSPKMTEIVLKCKGYDKVMLISDGGRFMNLTPGHYKIPFRKTEGVIVDERGIKDELGRLTSCKTALYNVKMLSTELNVPMMECLKMSSLNPAVYYGFGNRKGSLRLGKDADFIVIDNDFNVHHTYVEGVEVYDQSLNKDYWNPELIKNLHKVNE